MLTRLVKLNHNNLQVYLIDTLTKVVTKKRLNSGTVIQGIKFRTEASLKTNDKTGNLQLDFDI